MQRISEILGRVMMKNIKIFVTHTPNRKSEMVENDVFQHIIAGAVFNKMQSGLLKDNVGENISAKNKSYCELTTQYWAWKNVKADYYGFFHYRRYMSFNEKELDEDGWGVVAESYLTQKTKEKLKLDVSSIHDKVEKYDFLIAKGIPTMTLNGFDSVYDHYKGAPELHIEDLDAMLSIIDRDYPELSRAARKYIEGGIFYPCNMFVMRADLFQQYSAILFDLLEKFEKQADMSTYSREGYRTTGHLGERLLGIFYTYLKEQNEGLRLGECQVALIKNVEVQPEIIPSGKNSVPVVLAANDFYVPILAVCLQSIVDTISTGRNYDIVIFHTDITSEHMSHLQKIAAGQKNVRLDFVNVGKYVYGYRLQAKEHITTETFYRFLILNIMKRYQKVIYIDCDLIVKHDLAELYDVELGRNLIGAVKDADFQGQCNKTESDMKGYAQNVLKMKNPYEYFQAGVLLLNVEELNRNITVQQLFEMSDTGIYRFSDQDILNVVCEGRVTYLDMRWNLLSDCEGFRWKEVIRHAPHRVLDEYESARKNPFIIHYAGYIKPWKRADEDFAQEFWAIARKSEYYEVLMQRMCGEAVPVKNTGAPGWSDRHPIAYKVVNAILPLHSKRREYFKRIFGIRWS